ncbi:unnamed protein product [Polarella glacialis]|uniref:Uncharacterized protein n=1 Tax=Polarella glacialis TaxID=89957 RepID=A0A813DWX1_POLGL|nr:unnamed protein product [Polarella glacialis]
MLCLYRHRAQAISIGLPPLQSYLARWAKDEVRREEARHSSSRNFAEADGDVDTDEEPDSSDFIYEEADSECETDAFIRRMEDVGGEVSEEEIGEAEIEQQPLVLCIGMPSLQSLLARWAKAQVDIDEEAEQRAKNLRNLDAMLREMRADLAEEDSDCGPDDFIRRMEDVDGELSEDEIEQQPVVFSFGMPPLQSVLARWAKAQVDFDDEAEQRAKNLGDLDAMLREMRSDLAEEDSDCGPDDFIRRMEDVDGELSEDEIEQQPVVFSFGMPPLQSVLARWAKAQVDFDDEAEQRAKNLGDLDAMLREMRSDLAEEDSDCGPDDFIRRMEDVDGELSEDEIEQQPVVFMPPLQSVARLDFDDSALMPPSSQELARWAKAQVDATPSVLARWAKAQVEAEQRAKNLGDLDAMLREMRSDLAEEDSDCGPDDFIRRMEDVDGELSEDEIEQQPVVFSFGMPPLQSVLARWAKAQVDFDDEAEQRAKNLGDLDAMLREMRSDLAEEDSDCGPDDFIRRMEDVDGELSEDEIEQQPVVFSFGMPPLQSVLARWAKAQVDFDDEAEQRAKNLGDLDAMLREMRSDLAEEDSDCGPDDFIRRMEDVDGELSEDEIEQQPVVFSFGMPPLQSVLARWAKAQVDFDDEEDSDCGPDDFIRRMEDVDGELSEDEIEQQPVVFSFGMPPLQSVLARWAKAQVDFDDEAEQRAKNLGDLDAMLREMRSDLAEEDSDCGPDDFIRRMEDVDGELSEDEIEQQPVVFSFGMPPLQSVLARWAKAQVDFDDEAEQRAKNLGDLDAMLREMRSDLAEEDSDCGPDDFIRRMEDVDGELSEDEIEQQPVVFSFGMPPLQSVLARWAKAQVDFDDEAEQRAKNLGDLDAMLREMRSDLAEEDSDCGPDDFIRRMEDVDGELSEDEIEQQPVVFSFGMPPLQSVLARWAKAQVDFDDEAEQRAKNLGDLDAMLREMRSDLAEEDSDCGPDDFIRRMEDVDGELSEDEIEQQPVVFSFGMPPLLSVLARWAKAQVDFDDEAEQRAKNLGDLDAMLREMLSDLAEEDSDCGPDDFIRRMEDVDGELSEDEIEQQPVVFSFGMPPLQSVLARWAKAQVDFDDEAEQRAKNLGDLDAMLREMRSDLAEEAEVEEYVLYFVWSVLVSGDNAVPSFTSRLAAFFSLQPCLEGLSVCMSPRDNHHQVQ